MTTEQIIEEVFRRVMQILAERDSEETEAGAVIEIDKKFITESDVRDLAAGEGDAIRVRKKAVLTDIALEYLAKKKIKVQRMD